MKSSHGVLPVALLAFLMLGGLTCGPNRAQSAGTWDLPPEDIESVDEEVFDEFGGYKLVHGESTGFFHVEKIDGVWWIITPEGNGFLSKGVNAFWCPPGKENETFDWLRSIGLNSLGAWSTTDRVMKTGGGRMPYAELLNLLKAHAGIKGERGKTWPDVFSKGFVESARQQAETKVKPLASDPYLIGWWTDNELKWAGENPALLDAYLELPKDAPGRRVAEDFLAETFGSARLPKDPGRLESARDGFLEIAVRHYADVTARAIREYDKHHMILGSRIFFTPIPWKNTMPERMGGFEAIARAAAERWDILSVNTYYDDSPVDRLAKMYVHFEGPLLISEFNIGKAGTDQGLGEEPEWLARAEVSVKGLKKQLPQLFAEPYVVGYHYFPFSNHKDPKKNNSRAGLLSYQGEPRTHLIEALRSVNAALEEIHEGSMYER